MKFFQRYINHVSSYTKVLEIVFYTRVIFTSLRDLLKSFSLENVLLLHKVDVFPETGSHLLITGGEPHSCVEPSLLAATWRQAAWSPRGPESLSVIGSF